MPVLDIRESELVNIRNYTPCETDIGKRVLCLYRVSTDKQDTYSRGRRERKDLYPHENQFGVACRGRLLQGWNHPLWLYACEKRAALKSHCQTLK